MHKRSLPAVMGLALVSLSLAACGGGGGSSPATPVSVATATPLPKSSATPAPVSTATATPVPKSSPTATPAPKSSPTATPAPKSSPTAVPTASPTTTPADTLSATWTATYLDTGNDSRIVSGSLPNIALKYMGSNVSPNLNTVNNVKISTSSSDPLTISQNTCPASWFPATQPDLYTFSPQTAVSCSFLVTQDGKFAHVNFSAPMPPPPPDYTTLSLLSYVQSVSGNGTVSTTPIKATNNTIVLTDAVPNFINLIPFNMSSENEPGGSQDLSVSNNTCYSDAAGTTPSLVGIPSVTTVSNGKQTVVGGYGTLWVYVGSGHTQCGFTLTDVHNVSVNVTFAAD